MRFWIILITIGVLLFGAWLFYESQYGGIPTDVIVVDRGSVAEFVDERAETRLPQTYLITMPYSARLDQITVNEGEKVEKGQLVAQVVQADSDAKLRQAQSAVARLKASIVENNDLTVEESGVQQALKYVESMAQTVAASEQQLTVGEAKQAYAQKNYDRINFLFEREQTPEESMNDAELRLIEAKVEYQQTLLTHAALLAIQAATNLTPKMLRQYMDRKLLTGDVLSKELQEAEAQLEIAQLENERGRMKSPIKGTILEKFRENEGLVSGGTELLEIGDLSRLEIESDILSQNVVQVRVGNRVLIYGPAIGPEPVEGIVKRIYPEGFTKTSSLGVEQQRVKVIIGFESPEVIAKLTSERGLGVGYRVRVRIITEENPNALFVARSSIFRDAAGNWQTFTLKDRTAAKQALNIGLMNDERVEVKEGLEEGSLVVLAPETTLVDGTRVRPLIQEPPSPMLILSNND
ncbi:Efflux RND transporter periplasmic adaptor subunit [Planctomycetales bacterium 10988]|nr:Efflux RND transporter periplasmic adaptor subunit [Planctomycetales bacterium 10988]